MPSKLIDIDPGEVSLVDRAANQRRFLVLKAEDTSTGEGKMPQTILKSLQDLGIQDEALAGKVSTSLETLTEFVGDDAQRRTVIADVLGIPAAVAAPPAAEGNEIEALKAEVARLEKAAGNEAAVLALKSTITALEKSEASRLELQKRFDEERELRVNKEYVEKAAELKNLPGEVTDIAKALRAIDEYLPTDQRGPVRKMLEDANARLGTSTELLKEHGSNGEGTVGAGTVEQKVMGMARELVTKSEGKLRMGEALTRIFKEQPKLYEEYQSERAEQR